MANTYVDYTATAGQQYFAFNFPYLEDEHVIVEIEGVDQTITTNYTIETSPTQRINLSNPTTALAGGELVRIKRRSAPNTNLVDFQNGSVLTESELDRAYLHNRYLAEEATEGVDAGLKELEGSTNFNANNKQIKNLADGTLATDAVNKQYVDTQIALTDTNLAGFYKSTHTGNAVDNVFTLSFTPQTTDAKAYIVSIDGLVQVPDTDYTIGATAITFNTIPANSAEICVVATAAASVATVNEAQVTALGTSDTRSLATWTRDLNSPTATGSTTARSLADRFGEVVNVKDYGADPASADNMTAINSAFTAAFNAGGGTVYFPAGTYTVTDYVGFNSSSTDEINIQVIADAGAVLNVNPGSDPEDIRDYGLLLQSVNLKTCIVRGLEVQCNDKVSVGIRVNNNSGAMDMAVVEDCKVFNCKQTFYIDEGGSRVETTSAKGIQVSSTGWGYKATVENCIVQGVDRNLDGVCQGLVVTGFENSNVVNNTVRDVTVYKVNVTNATNASPIVITTDGNHNFITGDLVGVSSVGGNDAANGSFTITKLTDTTFQLDGSTGNGTYTSGGKAISDKDADGIVVFSHNSASDYKRSQVTVSENVVKNCEGRFIKLQTEGSVTVESNLLRLDSGTLITNFRGVDTQVANATIRNNQMYILGYTGGASAAFSALQAPGSSNFSSNESFVSEFCFNNIHTQVGFPYGVLTTSPNANEDPTIHFKINDNTITRNAASDSITTTDVACDEFVRLDTSTPASADFDATFYLEIARNKVFAFDLIRIPFTQDDYTDKWFFYVYDNYRFPTGFNRDVVLGGAAPDYDSPYTSTCMFRNNQTRADAGNQGNLGWPLDASRILEGSDFGLSSQTLTFMPDNPGTFGRLALSGGIYKYTKNNNELSYTSSDPESGWKVVGGLEFVSATDIASSSADVNTVGKFRGKQVFDGTNDRVMIANGSGATDVWYVVDGSASVTPSP